MQHHRYVPRLNDPVHYVEADGYDEVCIAAIVTRCEPGSDLTTLFVMNPAVGARFRPAVTKDVTASEDTWHHIHECPG